MRGNPYQLGNVAFLKRYRTRQTDCTQENDSQLIIKEMEADK